MMNIPNILTLSRIIATIPLFVMVYIQDIHFYAFLFFILVSLTDLIDGYLARKLNQVTNFGKFMDQIADKILINSLLIAFLENNMIPGWTVALMVSRDIFVSGLRMFLASKGYVLPADKLGKAKTFFQTILIGSLFLTSTVHELMYFNLFFAFVAAFLSVYSGVNYFVRNLEQIKV